MNFQKKTNKQKTKPRRIIKLPQNLTFHANLGWVDKNVELCEQLQQIQNFL